MSGQVNYQQIGDTYYMPGTSSFFNVAVSKDSNTIIYFDCFNLLGYVYERNLQTESAFYEKTSTFHTVDGVPGFELINSNLNLAVSYDASIVITGLENTNIGAAFIFKRNNTGFYNQLGSKLSQPIFKTHITFFGWQISCNLDCSVFSVSAPSQDDYGGVVYIYGLNGDSVSLMGELPYFRKDSGFGFTNVAINGAGTYLMVEGRSFSNKTSVVLSFTHEKNGWTELTPLINKAEEDDYFGSALAINQAGDVVVVGDNRGSWIYKKSRTSWNLVTSLLPNDLKLNTAYSYAQSLAMNDVGDVVAVSATGAGSGTMWVFSYNRKKWIQDGSKITSKDTSISSIGYSMSMNSDGSILVASATSLAPLHYGAFVVFQKTMQVSGCMPNPTAKEKQCRKMIKMCNKKHHIKMKFIQESCPGVSGESGCQCDQFCGYSCEQACDHDIQCYWANNQCYNKFTNLPGQSIQTCPVF